MLYVLLRVRVRVRVRVRDRDRVKTTRTAPVVRSAPGSRFSSPVCEYVI
jgi:hypothetical protein